MSRTKVRGRVIVDNPTFGGVGAIQIPVGTTTERDAGWGFDGATPSTTFSVGMLRYNSTESQFEGYDGSTWTQIAGGGSTSMALQKFTGNGTTVTYDVIPTDPTTPLASASTLMVDINGLMQEEGSGKAYTINLVSSPQTLTFSEAPATGDVITIRHLGEVGNVVNTVNSSAFGTSFGGTIDTANDKLLMLDASTNGVYTINVASVIGGSFPSQSGQTGKFLTTDGTNVSWATVDALPSQTGNADKFLKTDGTTASWNTVTASPNEGSYIIVTTTHSAVLGTRLLCDTTSAAFTITLPTTSLVAGEALSVTDGVGNFATNNVTVNGGTNNIVSTAGTSGTTLLMDSDGAVVTLVWGGSTWRAIV